MIRPLRDIADPRTGEPPSLVCTSRGLRRVQLIWTAGEYEDTKKVNDLLVEKNIDCPIHVDAASGGMVAPFVVPDLEWDFRCEKVVSINVSGHKYGLVSNSLGGCVLHLNIYRSTQA